MKGKLTARSVETLANRRGRYLASDGLYLRVLNPGRKVYWTYRFRVSGKDREVSVGKYPAMSLVEARQKHATLRAQVLSGADPLAGKHTAKTALATPTGTPTFGQCADQYIEAHEAEWKNRKHARQWRMTLTDHAAAIRSTPVDQIDTQAVLSVLKPIWTTTPETASRLRGRIEVVLASAQVAGHIPEDKPNPARWHNWLDHMLPQPKKLGARGHHAAMPYADLPEFMARLGEIDTTAARALAFTILTASRSGEVFRMTFDEIDAATWNIPASRMKMGVEHAVPLSDAALDILRVQEAERGKNPFVFPGLRPRQPLTHMAMSLVLKRMGLDATVHGFRTSFRTWAGEVAHVEFEIAEHCLAHAVGNQASQSYNRTTLLERRRPVMESWSRYVTGATNVVQLRSAVTA